MDSDIEKLLSKYWEAESSPAEEARLKALLKQEKASYEMEAIKALFEHFEAEKCREPDDAFEAGLLARLQAKPEAKVVSFNAFFRRYGGMAAALLLLFTAGFLFIQNQRNHQTEDTFDDPKMALEEVKKQLLMVSNYMNKGNEQINKIGGLSKADTGMHEFSRINRAAQSMRTLSKMNITK